MSIKIQVDELDAEMDYRGWLAFKGKVMQAMLKGEVSWDEGVAMRSLIDHALTQNATKQAIEELKDTNG